MAAEQWKYNYVLQNAHAMTAHELAEALDISDSYVYQIAKEIGVITKRSPHFRVNRTEQSAAYIQRPSRMSLLPDDDTEPYVLVRPFTIISLADDFFVEDIAEMLCLSSKNIYTLIRRSGKRPRWKRLQTPKSEKPHLFIETIPEETITEEITPEVKKPAPVIRMKKLEFERPKPIYTNLPSPFGLATELHKQNRIYYGAR